MAQDEALARHWYEQAASAGCVRAQNNLGMMLFDGRGGPKSPGQAASWFRLAAANGSMAAASNLGICYEDGIGEPGCERCLGSQALQPCIICARY